MSKLEKKVAIITGATSGMGKAIAEKFVREGAFLVISGRDLGRGRLLEKELLEASPNIIFLPGDVTHQEYNKKLVEAAISNFGRVDILSLNAGILGLGKVTDLNFELWKGTIDTNLSAIYYLCKYALPHMVKNKSGSVIVTASIAAFKGFPNHPAYCASKAGAVALAKQLAIDYAPFIRVNAICPGPVDTSMLWDSAQAFDHPDQAVKKAQDKTLLKRLGKPEDIADLALFLASDDSSWITGTAIQIDGGIMAK